MNGHNPSGYRGTGYGYAVNRLPDVVVNDPGNTVEKQTQTQKPATADATLPVEPVPQQTVPWWRSRIGVNTTMHGVLGVSL